MRLPVAWTDADAEPRPTNAEAGPGMVVAVVVVSPRCVIIVSDDHATITPGMPTLADIVTNQSCLVKQRRAVSDLNLVGGVGARGYEGTGAGEQCQCQFSHVPILPVGALRANVSTKAPFQQKWQPPSTWTKLHGTNASVPGGDRTLGTFRPPVF